MKQLLLSILLIAFTVQFSVGQDGTNFTHDDHGNVEQAWSAATPDEAVQILTTGNNAFLIVSSILHIHPVF